MVARSALFLALGGVAVLVFHACSSSEPAQLVAGACLVNSDCQNPLSCTFAKCHATCLETRDCTTQGEKCVKTGIGAVCQFVDESECTYNSQCPPQLKCAVDSRCRYACVADADCLSSQKCRSFVCADPADLDPASGDLDRTNPAGGWNGTNDEGGLPIAEGGVSDGSGDTSDASLDGGAAMDSSVDAPAVTSDAPAATGEGGYYVTDSSTCLGATGLSTFHPSNLPAVLDIPAGIKDWNYARSCSFDTDALTWDCTLSGGEFATRAVSLGGGREAAVLFMGSLVTSESSTITVVGQRPLIIVALSTVQIGGTIVAGASGQNAWYGGGAPGPKTLTKDGICPIDGVMGYGHAGSAPDALGLGAGGGGFCKSGGLGSAPDADGGIPALGGVAYGTPELVPLVGGSSGGSVSTPSTSNHGGGAVEIVAGDSILIDTSAIINMGGGTGAYGLGGGSGGAILLEAPKIIVKGVLAANGAGGGAYYGGTSQDGLPSSQPASGGKQDSTATRFGGKGGAGDTPVGGDGQEPVTSLNPGGGGGSAGRIRLNTGCGGPPTVLQSAIISPSEVSGCFTKGSVP